MLLEFSFRIVSNGVSLLSVIAAIALPTPAAPDKRLTCKHTTFQTHFSTGNYGKPTIFEKKSDSIKLAGEKMGNLSLSVFCYEIKAVDVFGDVKYSRFESVSLARNFNSVGLAGFDILELKIAE